MDKKIREKLLAELEMPPLTLKNCARIELSGNCAASNEGCKGIIEYSEKQIMLNLGSSRVRFQGFEMQISAFDSENASISGQITGLEFC